MPTKELGDIGAVHHLVVRPAKRAPVEELEETRAIAGKGIEGDHANGGSRQITLLAAEEWEEAAERIGIDAAPSCRRANVVLSGIDLKAAIGKELEIGEVVISIDGYNPACGRMNAIAPGLMSVLESKQRAGVFGRILKGGELKVGMAARVRDEGQC